MTDLKHTRVADELGRHAAAFLERESNPPSAGGSLITVTRVLLSPDFSKANVLISVFPTEAEKKALEFVKRHERDFRKYLATHARMRRTPSVTFTLDYGERNRQRIDELSNE